MLRKNNDVKLKETLNGRKIARERKNMPKRRSKQKVFERELTLKKKQKTF